jgi:hypothetical protein
MVEQMYPKFDYYLDETDPDILILRRQDGAFVAAFSARGATKEDYQALIRAQTGSLGLREDEDREKSA